MSKLIHRHLHADETAMQAFIGSLRAKGLSSKYIGDIISIVKTFAKWVRKTYHYENRIAGVTAPKIVHEPISLLTAHEQRRLCDHIKNHPDTYNIGIYITLNTGVRICELCALKWKDIDLYKDGGASTNREIQHS